MVRNKNKSVIIKSVIVFTLFAVLIVFVIKDIGTLSKISKIDMSKWGISKQYFNSTFSADEELKQADTSAKKTEWEYQKGIKAKELFRLTEQKGGILIEPPLFSEPDSDRFYEPTEYVVHVNNNYLLLNPVFDLNGQKVSVSDDNRYLTLLVPEKYKSMEKEILDCYNDWYTWKYYVDEDVHSERSGEKVREHEQLPLKIVYVCNGQKYFKMNALSFAMYDTDYVYDTIAVVVNGNNMGGDSYLHYISNDYYMYKYDEDGNGNVSGYKDILKNLGLDGKMSDTVSKYADISKYLHIFYSYVVFYTVVGIILISAIIIVIVSDRGGLKTQK